MYSGYVLRTPKLILWDWPLLPLHCTGHFGKGVSGLRTMDLASAVGRCGDLRAQLSLEPHVLHIFDC